MNHQTVKKNLLALANPEKAKAYARFFKTGPGEYGEGDRFLGLTTPQQREVAKKYQELCLTEIKKLLRINIHECRVIALIILKEHYRKANSDLKKKIYQFYLQNTAWINNWDLVDGSAPHLVGEYLLENPKEKRILFKLAKSHDLWEKRIAMMATFTFIREGQFKEALAIAEILLNDFHDLIHKAVGWMLREIGKKDLETEEKFLQKYAKTMPRTMLRYAIEKFPEKKRQFYLQK